LQSTCNWKNISCNSLVIGKISVARQSQLEKYQLQLEKILVATRFQLEENINCNPLATKKSNLNSNPLVTAKISFATHSQIKNISYKPLTTEKI
jgi:hypothetical protein